MKNSTIKLLLNSGIFYICREFPNFLFAIFYKINTIRVIKNRYFIYKIIVNNKIKILPIMEIIKQSESFNLKDSNDKFTMTGSANCEKSGSLTIHFNVNKASGEYLGDCRYNKHGENDKITFNVNCSEENRLEFIEYTNTIIEDVIAHFNSTE